MWKYAMIPLVGAVIGYVTNWIAVKMLFFPYYEKRFLGHRLPFTPGVIPKGQARLAKAAGEVIEQQLLTEDVLSPVLLSEDLKEKMMEAVQHWIDQQKSSEESLRDTALHAMSQDSLNELVADTEDDITDLICGKIIAMEPAKLLADKFEEEAKKRLADSMMGMFLGGSFLDKVKVQVEEAAQEYIDENLHGLIRYQVESESVRIQNMNYGEVAAKIEMRGPDIPEFIWKTYENFIRGQLPNVLKTLQFSVIVEDRINSMDIEQLEEIVLYIMKKELGAVINIGALIGLVLGLFNVMIMLLPV